jgi:hypothetical protein
LNGSVTLDDDSEGSGENGNAIVNSTVDQHQSCDYSVGGPSGFLKTQSFFVKEHVDQAQAKQNSIQVTLPTPAITMGFPSSKWPNPSSTQHMVCPFNGTSWNVPIATGSPISVTLTVDAEAFINVAGGGTPQFCKASASGSFSFTHN